MGFSVVIVIELLATGIEAMGWIGVILLSVLKVPWHSLDIPSGVGTLLCVAGLVVTYAVGVVVDRVSDLLFLPVDRMIERRLIRGLPSEPMMRLEVLHRSEGLGSLLSYARSRVRIARSTFLNLLILIVVIVSLSLVDKNWGRAIISSPLLVSIVIIVPLMALSALAWVRLSWSYYCRLTQSYDLLRKDVP